MNVTRSIRRAGFASLVMLTVLGGCTTSDQHQIQQQIGSTTVTTDQSSYTEGQAITVNWTGSPGEANDWVAIVPTGSPPDSGFIQYFLTNGQVDGSDVFAGLSAGDFEARAYASGTYSILATTTFTVTGSGSGSGSSGPATVTVTQAVPGAGLPITVAWTGTPGNANDWIAIVPAGSPPNSGFLQYALTESQADGSAPFNGVPVGSYEARAYLSGSYTIIGSTTFAMSGATTDRPDYNIGQPITVSWSGMPGNPGDWIAIVPAGSPSNSGFGQWFLTNSQVNGSQAFAGLDTGNYEARVYLAGSYTIMATATFTVGGDPPPPPPPATMTLDQATYTPGQPIMATWANSPGSAGDWVALVPAGSPPNSGFVQWFFTNGQVNGSQAFNGLDVGSYEVRFYLGGSYTISLTVPFDVSP